MEDFNDMSGFKKNIHLQPKSLSTKTIRSGIWVAGLRILNRGLGFIRTIILARLLAPEDFGLLGVAILAISTLDVFSQTGFHHALIQRKKNVESYLNVAWTVSVIRGIILFIILLFFAPIIATFFNSPQATLVIRLIAITTLFSGCTNIGMVLFQKELDFSKKFFYEFSAAAVDLAVAISLAIALRSVWALVWGGLTAGLVRLVMSYVIHPYRPKIELDREKFSNLFGFGKWILGTSILVFLITQGDDLFVARMLGITSLGLYQMAYLIANLPATEITHVTSQVTFPAFSKIQDDLPRVSEAYLKVLKITALTAIPLAGCIFILAPEFVQICLGNKWRAIIPLIQILVFAGLLRSLAATSGTIFHGLGKPKIDTYCQIIRLFILIILIYPFTLQWGIYGTSVAVLISITISTFCFFYMTIKITKCKLKEIQKIIGLPLINTAIMVFIVSEVKSKVPLIGALQFVELLGLCLLINLIFIFIVERYLNFEVLKLIRDRIAIN